MLREVYITIEQQDFDWPPLAYYNYRYLYALSRLDYVSHKRIDIRIDNVLTGYQKELSEWDDGKHARMIGYWEGEGITKPGTVEWHLSLLQSLYKVFRKIWEKHNWPVNDLDAINAGLSTEPVKPVEINIGPKRRSPDGQFVVQFYCLIHPGFAEYYLQVKKKGTRGVKHLFFYKGFIVADMFFMFFFLREWKTYYEFELKSYSEEIVFYFNVDSMQQELRIIPSENSLEYCQYMLSAFDAGTSFKEHSKRLGFK